VTGAVRSGAGNPRPDIVLVAAVARNGVIGGEGGLVWNIPEDMAHFKAVTAGGTVVMGRSTWESIPARFRPLPGRRNIVLSRQTGFQAPGAEVASTLEAALDLSGSPHEGRPVPQAVFVIGGAQVYAAALPRAGRLELTEIQADFDGDAHFPGGWREDFEELSRRRLRTAGPQALNIDFVTYERRRSRP
jgi:dihydrofolate reductase